MARYTGPVTKKSRSFGQSLTGYDKSFERKKYAPGQHGPSRRKKQRSDYALQLIEKQKAKYTYGVLERQFSVCQTLDTSTDTSRIHKGEHRL